MTAKRRLILVGTSAFAEVAYQLFNHDSDYEVIAFSVERSFLDVREKLGLPIVPFEELESIYDPQHHFVYVAIPYTQLNRLRTRLVFSSKEKGYKLASYFSSRAFIWPNVHFGEHCFVFEGNTLQPYVKVGNNVVLWSGNHIGHHSLIKDNCFIASHGVISGFCEIGANSFLGVNVTLANNIAIGEDNWIGPGVFINKNTSDAALFNLPSAEPSRVSSLRFFKVSD